MNMKIDFSLFNENTINSVEHHDIWCFDKHVVQLSVGYWSFKHGIKVIDEDYEILKNDYINSNNMYIMLYSNIHKRIKGIDYTRIVLDWISNKGKEHRLFMDEILHTYFYLFERLIYNLDKIELYNDYNLTKMLNSCGISNNELIFADLSINTRLTQENYSKFYRNTAWSYSHNYIYSTQFLYNDEVTSLMRNDVVLYISHWDDWIYSATSRRYNEMDILNSDIFYHMSNAHLRYNKGMLDVSINPEIILDLNEDILLECYNHLRDFCKSTFKHELLIEHENFTHILSGEQSRNLFKKYEVTPYIISTNIKNKLMDGSLILLEYKCGNDETILILENDRGYYLKYSILDGNKKAHYSKTISSAIDLLLKNINYEH